MPSPGTALPSSPLSITRALPPSLSLSSLFAFEKFILFPLAALDAPLMRLYGEGYLDYELERLEDLRSSKLVPSLSQRIVSKI